MLSRVKKEILKLGSTLVAQRKKVEVQHQLGIDWLPENHAEHTPQRSVGQGDPFDAFVRGIVDGLPGMSILEVQTDGFHLDEHLKFAFDSRRQVTMRSSDIQLARHFVVLVVPEDLRQHVGDDHRRIRLIDVPRLRGSEDGLKALQTGS
jgi:hypothetical protein